MERTKFSLLACLRALASDGFLKSDLPREAYGLLQEKGLIQEIWGRGWVITERGEEALEWAERNGR